MSFFNKYLVMAIALLEVSCGRLKSSPSQNVEGKKVENSSYAGIVVHTKADSSSTTLYYYDLEKGKVDFLVGGESADVLAKWMDGLLYVFNRALGRVSYSTINLEAGSMSRSIERTIPGAGAFDPSSANMGSDGELLLSMNAKGTLVIADLASNKVLQEFNSDLLNADAQKFRPDLILVQGNVAYVAHQALSESYEAVSGGGVMVFQKTESPGFPKGRWNFVKKISLRISNPGFMKFSSDDEILIGGVCYPESGSKCFSGLERVTIKNSSSQFIRDWNQNLWAANGNFSEDLSDSSVLACVSSRDVNNPGNFLIRVAVDSGEESIVKKLSGARCAGIVADSKSQQLILGESDFSKHGFVSFLDAQNKVLSKVELEHPVVDLTPVPL